MMDEPQRNTMDDPTRERLRWKMLELWADGYQGATGALDVLDAILDDLLTTHTISLIREPVHGTIYTYTRKKCRCDECREANRDYSREYRAGLRREAGKNG